MDKSTGIFNAIMRKCKKKQYTGNIKPSHAFFRRISVDEDSIIATRPLSLRFHGPYTFSTHAANA
jgi:hypothetical protein